MKTTRSWVYNCYQSYTAPKMGGISSFSCSSTTIALPQCHSIMDRTIKSDAIIKIWSSDNFYVATMRRSSTQRRVKTQRRSSSLNSMPIIMKKLSRRKYFQYLQPRLQLSNLMVITDRMTELVLWKIHSLFLMINWKSIILKAKTTSSSQSAE